MSDFKAKCTKFDIRLGLTGRAYSAPPDSLAGFEGPTSKGGDGTEEKGEEGRKRGGERKEEKGGERRPFW